VSNQWFFPYELELELMSLANWNQNLDIVLIYFLELEPPEVLYKNRKTAKHGSN